MNDIVLNKKISLERCIRQIRTYYALDRGLPFEADFLKQDAIALNLQRICELSLDIANYLIKRKKLGLPQNSSDAFALLQQAGVISEAMRASLHGMVGFRNVLVHEYQQLDLSIMVDVIEHHLHEPLDFATVALQTLD